MSEEIDHPLFGKLVRSEFGDELMMFRQFPFLKEFWVQDSEKAISNPYLSSEHRTWVVNWKQHTEELSQVCRDATVHSALQSLGIYEVCFDIPPNGELQKTQVSAYEYFVDHEEKICANIIDALLRYYHFAREQLPDWFEEDDPHVLSLSQIGEYIGFDGFSICRDSANGASALRAGWDPSWDPEHGLQMGIYKDEVIAIGTDEVNEVLHDPEVSFEFLPEILWGPKQMTLSEKEALKQYSVGHTPADDMEY